MKKGIALLGIFIIATIGILGGVLVITQQVTKTMAITLTFNEKGLIEDKINLDAESIFLQNGLWIASQEAAFLNGQNGGLYKEDWPLYQGFVLWKSEDSLIIPDDDLVTSEFLDNVEDLFNDYNYFQYLEEVYTDGELIFEILDENGDKELSSQLNLFLESDTLDHNIFARPTNLSADISRYFRFYELGKTFTQNAEGLIDYDLWEEINSYNDHDERDVSGECEKVGSPSFGEEPTSEDFDAFFDNVGKELSNRFSSESIKWDFEILDSDLVTHVYTHEYKETSTWYESVCEDYVCSPTSPCDPPGVYPFCCIYGGCDDECVDFQPQACATYENWCIIPNCVYRDGYYTYSCSVHYDKTYDYSYIVKVEIIDDDPNDGVLREGEIEDLKMVFLIQKDLFIDNQCGGDHACDTGSPPAPENPYQDKDVDEVFS